MKLCLNEIEVESKRWTGSDRSYIVRGYFPDVRLVYPAPGDSQECIVGVNFVPSRFSQRLVHVSLETSENGKERVPVHAERVRSIKIQSVFNVTVPSCGIQSAICQN